MAVDQETIDAVSKLIEAKLAPQVPSAAPQPYGSQLGGLTAPQNIVPIAISFRIKVPLPDGREASGYMHFSTENCHTPQAIQMLAAQVAQQYPIEAYMPRNNGGWGQGQGGGGGPGYGGRGGYGGGGYGGRGRY